MIKEEFQEMIGQIISDQDYEIIDTVYNFHPTVNGVSGKEEVAELYKSFGMDIFYDLFPRAKRNLELKRKLNNAQEEITRIKEDMTKPLQGAKMEMSKGEEIISGLPVFNEKPYELESIEINIKKGIFKINGKELGEALSGFHLTLDVISHNLKHCSVTMEHKAWGN